MILSRYSHPVSLESGLNPDQFNYEGSSCHFPYLNEKPLIIHIFTCVSLRKMGISFSALKAILLHLRSSQINIKLCLIKTLFKKPVSTSPH